MDITLVTPEREFKQEIWFFDTVLEIKKKIEKYEGYPIPTQTLIYNGKVLADDGDTELYEILEGSKIQLIVETEEEKRVKAEEPVRVLLTINISMSKKQFSIESDVTDNVSRLKERIQESEGIPVGRFALYFGGGEMQGNRTLADYGVADNSEVSVVIRPFMSGAPVGMGGAGQKKMKVFVMPKCGTKKIPVEVNPSDNVSELRKELLRLHGDLNFHLPSEGYFFIYKQNVVDEDRTFRWHHVQPGDTIEIFNGSVSGGN
ncbi:polyubiquitin-like [Asparagus officinalis]|uniref:polyubiquitin-like n=1 Tax=Asparagus officinalis TaxID=4686 RepID=UPI00098E112C|nr:polyubiquitin-like [Asparagus officinalis]